MGVKTILSLVMKLSNNYSGLNHLNNPLQEIIKSLYSLVLISHSKNNKTKQIESPPSLYTLSMFFFITICVIIVSNWVTKYASWEQSCLKRKCGSTVSLRKLVGNQRVTWMAFDEFHKKKLKSNQSGRHDCHIFMLVEMGIYLMVDNGTDNWSPHNWWGDLNCIRRLPTWLAAHLAPVKFDSVSIPQVEVVVSGLRVRIAASTVQCSLLNARLTLT